jgi:hypothetical protein
MNGSSASWAYLAGFTDGDGCISREVSKGRYTYARIRWNQKESDSAVLDWIGDFLVSQGIKTGSRRYSVATAGHRYPQRELGITNAEDTRLVLHQLVPYLVVKRQRAIEALALLDHVHQMKLIYGNKYRISTGGCSRNGCRGVFYAKGLCRKHYDEERRSARAPS